MSIVQFIIVILCFVCTYQLSEFMAEKPKKDFKQFKQVLKEEERKRERLEKNKK